MTIANPIYDTVFKYLMEDERIARTILSALLKENIVNVEVRPHEYTNGQKETLSIFRIDFGATVLKPNGEKQLILIELQKTWLPTETLRFRQYLGVHYQNPKNIVADSPDRHALPMVAVYLLGHTVGEIEDPVVYVRHEAFDYDDEPIVRGIPDKFIDSLNHDSIIVQIPRLHGKINNRLDKVLSIFDQSLQDGKNSHTIDIDAETFSGDADMQPIIRRLEEAAADSKVRRRMDVEDEFFSVLKSRDTEIMAKDMQLAEKTVAVKEATEKLTRTEEKLGKAEEKLGKAEEQRALAEKKTERILRNSVIAFLKTEMSAEDIASMLGIDIATVTQIAKTEE